MMQLKSMVVHTLSYRGENRCVLKKIPCSILKIVDNNLPKLKRCLFRSDGVNEKAGTKLEP